MRLLLPGAQIPGGHHPPLWFYAKGSARGGRGMATAGLSMLSGTGLLGEGGGRLIPSVDGRGMWSAGV